MELPAWYFWYQNQDNTRHLHTIFLEEDDEIEARAIFAEDHPDVKYIVAVVYGANRQPPVGGVTT